MSGGGAGGRKEAETVQEAQRKMLQRLNEFTDSMVYAAQRSCGGKGAAAAEPVPQASRKLVRSLKEIVDRPEAEIYAALLDCDMDPDEAVRRLLSQDTLHQEVKMKPDSKKKEVKGTPEPRSRAAKNVTTRGVAGPGMASTNSTQKQTVPTSPVNQNLVADAPSVPPPQTSSVFQHGWSGTPWQLSMADVMEMCRPQAQGKPSTKTVVTADTKVDSVKQVEMSSLMAVTSAMDSPMSSSLGAMGPLLRKLDLLLPPGYRLPKLLKDRIQLLKADLEEISVALLEQSMVDSPNEMAKYWMDEVRELCYDIEDFIDNMMFTHADAKMRSLQSYKVGRVKIASFPKTLKPCTRAAKVAELSTLVREASERHDRYFDGCTSSSSRRVFTGHGRIPAMYAEAANNLVGIDDSKAKLIKWLTDEEEQQLKVVAVAGPAGVGKTTLAKQVYREVGEQFECQAFVRASRKPDMRRLLGGILSQVQGGRRSSDSCTVQNIIANLTKHLQDKRYVIVIDDLWETTAWDIVTSAFPEGYNCSRIITTTEIEVVALECCDYQSNNILKMKPLGGEDSGKLLTNLVFGPEHLCPEQFRVPSDIIITKCAGLPLATTFVTGLLTTQPNNPELWQHVQECLSSTLSTNSTMEETLQEILKLSYNSLPHYLKTCLIYLSVYPEGYTLWKIDLVKHWMAEGFIRAIEGTDTAEVADSYFDELVNRGMIQAVDINYNGEVLSCTMHHIVLDLIALESTEKRFITVLDYSEIISEHYSKARRLSLHFSNTRYAMKPTGLTMSNVRSICFFGILECVPTIVGFKHLRILILEFWGDQQGSTTFNLTRICRLFQLRYLKILCDGSVEVELPTQMRMLQYLETLIIDAAVSAVPLDIVDLPGLLHLFLGDKADLPDKIGLLRSLRTLYCFDLGSNSEDNVLSLGDLMNLQDLHLTYCTEESSEHLKRNLTALASSLGKLVNLKSVTLAPSASGTAIYHDVWSSMSYLPVCLQRLEFLPPICIFSRFPKWIGQLRKLHTLQVVVNELLMEDMDILIGLPALTTLSLYVRRPTVESIIFRRGAFLGLKYFKYTCGALSLAFQEEAFPNLQRLELSFNAHRGEQYDNLLLGIDNLLNVKEIAGTIGAAAGAEEPDRRVAESAFKDAIRKHPRFPSYDDVKRVDWVCEEYQITTQEKDSSSENHQILQKELKRKEGDSSDDQSRIVLKEIEEDSKLYANKISHFPTTGSIIPFDQMMTDTEEDNAEETDEEFTGDEGKLKGLRAGGTFEGSTGTSSLLTTSDDASSMNTEAMFYKHKIRSWSRGMLLGSGSFGMVYEGISDEGVFFAVKELSLLDQGSNAQQSIFAIEQEIALLSQFEHENIVHYYGSDKEESTLYIFIELVTQGSLLSLYQKYKLRDTHVSAYTRQILNGLVYLHERNVVHRDIRCANILVHANGSVKLADFGLAKEMSKINMLRSCKGSVYWMAPEVVNPRKTYGPAADMWSLGCTVLEMLTRKIPYPNVEWTNAFFMIGRGEQPPMPSNLSRSAQDFIGQCVRVNPEERPTASELLAHPFINRSLRSIRNSIDR